MKLISNLRNSSILKRILFYLTGVLLFAYVFSVPSFGEATNITRYIVYVSMSLLGIVVIIYLALFDSFRLRKVFLLIPLFSIFALFGTILFSHEFRSWLSLILLAISFFVFTYAFKIIKSKYIVVAIISSAFFAFSLFFIACYWRQILDFRSYTNDSFRLGWRFDNPNGVSAYAVVGVITPLYLVLFWNKKIRFAFIIPILTSLLVGLTTGSRTFLLVVVIVIAVFLYFKFEKHKFIYLGVLAGLVVLSIGLLNLPFMSTMKYRLLQAIQTIFGVANKADTSTIQRVVMIDYGTYLGSKNIFFGYGVNGFAIKSGIGTYAHSNYAEVICDFGVIGFLIFYAPLVILLWKIIVSKKSDKTLVISFVIYYFIASFSNVLYYKKIYYLMLAFLFFVAFIEPFKLHKKSLLSKLEKIVFVCDSMGSGGAEKVISCLSNEFSRDGISVCIVGVADLNKPASFYKLENNVLYKTLSNGSGKRINSIKRVVLLRRLIISEKPDVVISFLPNANIYTSISLIGSKIPHIVSERNNPYIDPKRKIVRLLKKASFSMSQGCVFQTNDALNYYNKSIRKKGTIIKNPIILNVETPSLSPVKNHVILNVARLTKQKNHRCLIDAFKLFNEQKENRYTLKIYGDGPLRSELINYCQMLNLSNYVIFAGNDKEWQRKELNAAMFVLSSDYEGMPNALAEAMALGIPSISTDCPTGGSRELIADGKNGYLAPVNDPVALSEKMLILSNQSQQLFYNETRRMLDDYSAKTISQSWVTYIKGLAKNVYE